MSATAAHGRAALLRRTRIATEPLTESAAQTWNAAGGESGVVLGRRLRGELALPCAGREVILSAQRLARHVLLMGATGSGKTETALRIAWALAKHTDALVFFVDGKGDRQTAERFVGLMADAGRHARVFPNEPFDGWRGDSQQVMGRLVEIVDYSSEGPAAWYRDVAKAALALATEHPEGPPRSSGQLLARLDFDHLAAAHPGSPAVASLSRQLVSQVRLRYQAFFAQTRGSLDGNWCWEDTDAAYFLLDSLSLREETGSLARFVFEDFACFFSRRKPREQFCVMVVDEFSALADHAGMAARIEQARAFNTALVLAPQVAAGMGDEIETARILGSVETIVCHRVNTPEDIIALAGTVMRLDYSSQFEQAGATGAGSARLQHHYKIDPNEVRSLPVGEAYVIARGKAMRVRVNQAPQLSATLPEPLAPADGTAEAEREDRPVVHAPVSSRELDY
ncbi:MAG TPA: DEAD/DEAH box helicase family protein [Solirubrobacteraceae bacterium]|jgi:hypothetical protein